MRHLGRMRFLRRSRAARQPAWLVHFDCRSRRLLAGRAPSFRAAGQVHGRSSPPTCTRTRKSNPAPESGGTQRQRSPLATRRQDIENRLHNTAQIGPARPAAQGRPREQARDEPPLRSGHIACKTQFVRRYAPSDSVQGIVTSFGVLRWNHTSLRSLTHLSVRLSGRGLREVAVGTLRFAHPTAATRPSRAR